MDGVGCVSAFSDGIHHLFASVSTIASGPYAGASRGSVGVGDDASPLGLDSIQTADQALWANLLLSIGVRKPGE